MFLDKDGTLVVNVPYNVDPARIVFARGAEHAVRCLSAHGFRVIVVSNQPGAALGMFPEEALKGVQAHLEKTLPALDGCYYCPHRPEAGCGCRKPEPGLLERAAEEHAVDLSASWMVGDILDDIEAGRRAGCRTVLLDVGNETEWRMSEARRPNHVAAARVEAAASIVGAQ